MDLSRAAQVIFGEIKRRNGPVQKSDWQAFYDQIFERNGKEFPWPRRCTHWDDRSFWNCLHLLDLASLVEYGFLAEYIALTPKGQAREQFT